MARIRTSETGNEAKISPLSAGYTLLELLVVLAIIAVLTGAGFAVLRPQSEAGRLRTAMAELENDLRYARSVARAEQHPVSVEFRPDTAHWRLDGRHVGALPAGGQLQIELSAPQGLMQFFPDGSCSGGRITGILGKNISVLSIDWLTCRIEQDG